MKPVKKILFLTDNFPPEVNAPATRTYEHAIEWHKEGYEVIIMTSFPNYPIGKIFEGYKQRAWKRDRDFPFKVIRVWTIMFPNEGFFKRVIDQLSYALMVFVIGLFIKADVIVATSPQFFTAVSGRWLSFFKRTPWIMEIRDLWPETIAAVGAMNKGRIYRVLERLELRLYKSAFKLIVVTDTFKKKISARGIEPNKISVHKNGVILEKFKPRPKDVELLDIMPELKGKFIFGYIGTHGMTHGLDFVLKAIKQLENSNPEIHFLFIGEGAEKQNLVKLSEILDLSNITFHPLVSKDVVSRYLSLMDVSLVNLKNSDTFKTVIPSKIFEAAALQKPILLGLEGETKEIIQSFNAGLCFEPENESEFINQCKAILDTQRYKGFQKGCEKLAQAFDRKQIALEVLKTITTD